MKLTKTLLIITALLMALVSSSCGTVAIDLGNNAGPEAEVDQDEIAAPDEEMSSESARSGDLIPDGVLVSTGSEDSLTYLNWNGQVVSEVNTPGTINLSAGEAVVAGAVVSGQPLPPVVYRSWKPDQGLMVSKDGQVALLRQSNSILSITAAPGQTALAFSEVALNEDNLPHAFLYAGKPDNLGNVGAFYDLLDSPNYMALMPVGVQAVGGEPQGVWYTKTAWGIGGADLIFPITRGLFFFDLTSGDNLRFIDDQYSFQGISPDLNYAGLVDFDFAGNRAMSVVNLANNAHTEFALDPATDRGAGFAVFSPDSRYAAWLEASGSMVSDPYDFHPRVRVGDIQSGGIVQVLDDDAAAQAISGDHLVGFMVPVGWLSNETLLVEVRSQSWEDVFLLEFDIATGGVSVFAAGSFISFAYQ
ncbi:MAG: hypothetical protein J7L66_02745 [Anaerolineaceae bacterium]|nr:hypothetical protein [Anaerolineaceae bacterium]